MITLSISQAADLIAENIHTLRYWEKEFSDFLKPIRTPGGQRRYRPEDMRVLHEIERLIRIEHYSHEGVRAQLRRFTDAAQGVATK